MEIPQAKLEKLLSENPEFKKLYKEHSVLKSQVEEYNQRKFLTPEEELEKKNIQKQKLKYKDRLTEISDQHRTVAN